MINCDQFSEPVATDDKWDMALSDYPFIVLDVRFNPDKGITGLSRQRVCKIMKAEKPTTEDINRLKAWIEANNYTVYTVLRHVSKSGMYREISVVIPIIDIPRYDNNGDKPRLVQSHVQQFVHPSYTIAGILGWSYSEKNGHNAIVVTGCGMDMGFHLVDSLSHKLYGDGYKIKQEWI